MPQRAELRLDIGKILKAQKDAAARGLQKGAEHLLQVSRELVPHEEGVLERSGVASVDGLRAAVSFDTPYAVRQHEDLTLKHDDGRQGKYLEGPMATEQATIAELVAAEIRRSMK